MDPVAAAALAPAQEGAPRDGADPAPRKARVATLWLGGCSGCHMSFLDLDERLVDLARLVELVYSPLVDVKEYPEGVDVALVEGAVANEEHLVLARKARARSKVVLAFGDCAVTGNVTALRNVLGGAEPVLQRAYVENVTLQPGIPRQPGIVPVLLDRVRALHEVIPVDVHLPGCPPSADLIFYALTELLAGRKPDLTGRLHFG